MLSALEVEPRSLADVGAIGAEDAEPGELLECGPRLVVACGPRLGVAREAAREEGSALELVRVQLAGKRALAAEEFLRGAHLSVGERLGAPRRD
jgi:methionyl-tRNA formyltransferase